VLGHGNPGEGDDSAVAVPYVIVAPEDTLFKMWYGGSNSILLQTGYATSGFLVSVEKEDEVLPEVFVLHQNYPNPFNPSTKIKFTIPSVGTQRAVSVLLKVYDVLGNEIATLVDEYKPAGVYEVEFSVGQDSSPDISSRQTPTLTSGVYFYQLRAGEFIQTKKMVILK
jgi:hypothetical protein